MSKNNPQSDENTENRPKNNQNENEVTPALDPRLVEYIRGTPYEDLLVEMDGSKGRKGDKLNVVREWFSPENDYRADTFITPSQVYALSLLRNIDQFDLLKDLQPFMDDVIDDLERYALSMSGYAREQETNVLRSMFGDRGELAQSDKDNMLLSMLSNPDMDESE